MNGRKSVGGIVCELSRSVYGASPLSTSTSCDQHESLQKCRVEGYLLLLCLLLICMCSSQQVWTRSGSVVLEKISNKIIKTLYGTSETCKTKILHSNNAR
ncbi:hypothetical protein NPIL_43811 [Nephila pilipes]|uniref:Uncharacterized protein n=1 Tax=Nephila pilipes TaxID=299642 RepID=A0A8X6TRC7_NEPPI|nr:hypothetical protein NPIL_43811 [Nephila pilipes]